MSDEFLPQVAWAIQALTKQCHARGYLALAHLLDLAHQETMDEIAAETQPDVTPNVVGLTRGRGAKVRRVPAAESKPANPD